MPACINCRMLKERNCLAQIKAKELGRGESTPPIGACMLPIVENYLQLIESGMKVLDIGCGSWDMVKKHCQEVDAHYEGIDVVKMCLGKPTVATRLENLAKLSYPDEYFDIVIANQSMEHWPEFGCSLEWGLYQCFRVVKKGGKILLNVPIHFHGVRIFLLGELDKIRSLFNPFSHQILLEKWGEPSDPLPPFFGNQGYSPLQDKPSYVLDIQATKEQPTPANFINTCKTKGLIAKIIYCPLSYTPFRVIRKVKLFIASKLSR